MYNEETRAWLPLHLIALSYAEDKLGVQEDFVDGQWTNWGPEIKEFLNAAGINAPAPWCAAYCAWAVREACKLKGVENPFKDLTYKAYVPAYVEWAREHNSLVSPADAGPGDLFLLYFPSLGRYAHMGFVIEVNEQEGWFTTVEGNGNDEASREGYKVVSRRRSLTNNVRFIRYD
jgi:hypothetical protein